MVAALCIPCSSFLVESSTTQISVPLYYSPCGLGFDPCSRMHPLVVINIAFLIA